MPDVYDSVLSCGVQIFSAVCCGNPAAFARDGERIGLLEIARKERSMIQHGVPILAEPEPYSHPLQAQSFLPQRCYLINA